MTAALVSTEWLAAHLGQPDIAIVDASWHMPDANRDARAEFLDAHLPGAVHFDIDRIADLSSGLPHTLADEAVFAEAAGALGISEDQTIVVYEAGGLFAAARVWWNFRIMGAEKVFILDGGLTKWTAEGRPVDRGEVHPQPRTFLPRIDHGAVAHLDDMKAALDADIQIVDARSPGRYSGQEADPRAGVRSGHVPGSHNVHYRTLLTPDGRLKDAAGLSAAFNAGGVDPARAMITTCGSGVTAAILALAVHQLGQEVPRLYDGSWSEWGSRDDVPIAQA
ncbi:3-mercaptopyruvate sulfurtransferase [Terrihabitans sp. B22-R8]|uniref:3-mercaptopyruvate sulfurtransferase n=1 Tax=Terrihabitans sp. B22-R8 TaxID=3425128 RepID=UPI00403C0F9D